MYLLTKMVDRTRVTGIQSIKEEQSHNHYQVIRSHQSSEWAEKDHNRNIEGAMETWLDKCLGTEAPLV
jgi:hypothetical protein